MFKNLIYKIKFYLCCYKEKNSFGYPDDLNKYRYYNSDCEIEATYPKKHCYDETCYL
jgi:hypothetical protein